MLQPTAIKPCEIVPLEMLWFVCACVVCVAHIYCLCLKYLEMRRSLDSLALLHSILRSFPPLRLMSF